MRILGLLYLITGFSFSAGALKAGPTLDLPITPEASRGMEIEVRGHGDGYYFQISIPRDQMKNRVHGDLDVYDGDNLLASSVMHDSGGGKTVYFIFYLKKKLVASSRFAIVDGLFTYYHVRLAEFAEHAIPEED